MMKGDAFSVFATAASVAGMFVLLAVQPPTGLAAPTLVCRAEVGMAGLLFVSYVLGARSFDRFLSERMPWVSRSLGRRVRMPRAVRAAIVVVVLVASTIFAFWTLADVLGGYNGYGYSFSTYPLLHQVYLILGLRYIGSWDVGNQASFFFLLIISGIVVLRVDRGVRKALGDSVTLFAAPALVAFELALWYFAPADMSWHVTDFLWVGGANDLGYRTLGGGGAYLVSNWLVLFVSFFVVASRIPWLRASPKDRRHGDEAIALGATERA